MIELDLCSQLQVGLVETDTVHYNTLHVPDPICQGQGQGLWRTTVVGEHEVSLVGMWMSIAQYL